MAARSEEIPENIHPLPKGYEYEFVSTLEKRHLCVICELPYKDAVQTKCGHRFCRGCLVESLRRKNECPLDRQTLDQDKDIFADLSTQREIMDLHVKCASERCDWVGELRDAETHLEKCTNENCQMEVPRMHFEKHVKNECEWYLVCCSYCGFRNPKREAETHLQQCTRFPVACVNSCNSFQVPRCEMQDHVTGSCPLTLVPCPFQFAGCKEKIERRNFDQHMSSFVESHLRLSSDKLYKLEQRQMQMAENLEQQEQSKVVRDNKVALKSIENDLIPQLERGQKQIRNILHENRESRNNFQEKLVSELKRKLGDIQEQINETEQRRYRLKDETDDIKENPKAKDVEERVATKLQRELKQWKVVTTAFVVCLFAVITGIYFSKPDSRFAVNWKQCTWTQTDAVFHKDEGLIHSCSFYKKINNTYLRVTYQGNIGVYGNYTCSRWYFTFNGSECSDPVPIEGVYYTRNVTISRRAVTIGGLCSGITPGAVNVEFKVGACAGAFRLGDTDMSWNTNSRVVIEELNIPQD